MNKIAVVIPIYNTEDRLHVCIQSVLNQTVSSQIHIVLVDDGSSDRSGEICDEYGEKYENITVIHKNNGGAASARNVGIDWVINNGSFHYIAFVDSDDIIHPKMYEVLLRLLGDESVDIASCYYQFILPDSKVEFEEIPNEIEICETIKCADALANFKDYCRSVSLISPCMRLCKIQLFEDLRFKEGYIEEDSMILPYLWDKAVKQVRTPLKLYYWVERKGSVTRQGFNVKSFAHIMVSYVRMDFFYKKGIKSQRAFFSKEFMNRCVQYYCNAKGDKEKEKAFLKYRRLYNKNWLKCYFSCGFCPQEYLMHLLFLLHIPKAESIFKKLNPDWKLY